MQSYVKYLTIRNILTSFFSFYIELQRIATTNGFNLDVVDCKLLVIACKSVLLLLQMEF